MKLQRSSEPIKFRAAVIFIGIIVVVLGAYMTLHTMYNRAVHTPVDSADDSRHELEIEKGMTATEIGNHLASNDLIRSPFIFKMYVRNEQLENKFVAGRFALRRDQSLADIVTELTNPSSAEQWITILEGWRAQEIAEYLASEGHITQAEFMHCVATCTFDSALLATKPADQGLEGYLFPDTYIIPADATSEQIIQRMLDNLEAKLSPEMQNDIEKQGRTIHEILTMASIIEREVRGDEERKIVSGILWKRYEEGMGLGADATVLYALGDWKAPLTSSSLDIDSPYNTRKYRGLPPGPIASPSLSSITAAIYPEDSPYWYYLTTLDTGEVKYGRTLEEHAENRRKYL